MADNNPPPVSGILRVFHDSEADQNKYFDYKVSKGDVIVGRNRESCDLALPFHGLSRKHCRILIDEEEHFIMDLNSRNKTYRRTHCLRPNIYYELTDGVELTLSNVRCQYFHKNLPLQDDLSDHEVHSDFLSYVEETPEIGFSIPIKRESSSSTCGEQTPSPKPKENTPPLPPDSLSHISVSFVEEPEDEDTTECFSPQLLAGHTDIPPTIPYKEEDDQVDSHISDDEQTLPYDVVPNYEDTEQKKDQEVDEETDKEDIMEDVSKMDVNDDMQTIPYDILPSSPELNMEEKELQEGVSDECMVPHDTKLPEKTVPYSVEEVADIEVVGNNRDIDSVTDLALCYDGDETDETSRNDIEQMDLAPVDSTVPYRVDGEDMKEVDLRNVTEQTVPYQLQENTEGHSENEDIGKDSFHITDPTVPYVLDEEEQNEEEEEAGGRERMGDTEPQLRDQDGRKRLHDITDPTVPYVLDKEEQNEEEEEAGGRERMGDTEPQLRDQDGRKLLHDITDPTVPYVLDEEEQNEEEEEAGGRERMGDTEPQLRDQDGNKLLHDITDPTVPYVLDEDKEEEDDKTGGRERMGDIEPQLSDQDGNKLLHDITDPTVPYVLDEDKEEEDDKTGGRERMGDTEPQLSDQDGNKLLHDITDLTVPYMLDEEEEDKGETSDKESKEPQLSEHGGIHHIAVPTVPYILDEEEEEKEGEGKKEDINLLDHLLEPTVPLLDKEEDKWDLENKQVAGEIETSLKETKQHKEEISESGSKKGRLATKKGRPSRAASTRTTRGTKKPKGESKNGVETVKEETEGVVPMDKTQETFAEELPLKNKSSRTRGRKPRGEGTNGVETVKETEDVIPMDVIEETSAKEVHVKSKRSTRHGVETVKEETEDVVPMDVTQEGKERNEIEGCMSVRRANTRTSTLDSKESSQKLTRGRKRGTKRRLMDDDEDELEEVKDKSSQVSVSQTPISTEFSEESPDISSVNDDTSSSGVENLGPKNKKRAKIELIRTPRIKKQKSSIEMKSPVSTPKRLKSGRSSVTNSPAKRLSTEETPKVMFTGVTDEEGAETVKQLGGLMVDSVFQCTHLVTDKVRRTVKFLCCLSRGCTIVSTNWLDKCREDGCFVSTDSFIVKDRTAERIYGFSLKDSIVKARSSPLLKGWSVFMSDNIKPPPNEMKEIVQSAGGQIVDTCPTEQSDHQFIISCEEDSNVYQHAISEGVSVCTNEIILTGVLRQLIEIETHQLKNNKRKGSSTTSGRAVTKRKR